jgi:hypothetical protein
VVLHDLVVEHGEVEGKTEADGVAGGELDASSLFVSLEGVLLNRLELGILCVLSDVAVVVTDHLDEEGLGLASALLCEHLIVDGVDDHLAVVGELLLDGFLVRGESISVLLVLGVLLNSVDGAAGSTLGRDQVLEGNGEEVTLVGGDLGALGVEDGSKEGNHIFESLGLLSNTRKEDVFFN